MHGILKAAKLWQSWSLHVPVFGLCMDLLSIVKPSAAKAAACKVKNCFYTFK